MQIDKNRENKFKNKWYGMKMTMIIHFFSDNYVINIYILLTTHFFRFVPNFIHFSQRHIF